MSQMQQRAGLQVASELAAFVEREALAGLGISAEAFWKGLADIFARFAPENRALLAERDRMQAAIDAWHRDRRGQAIAWNEYRAFLESIGYLASEPAPFKVS